MALMATNLENYVRINLLVLIIGEVHVNKSLNFYFSLFSKAGVSES